MGWEGLSSPTRAATRSSRWPRRGVSRKRGWSLHPCTTARRTCSPRVDDEGSGGPRLGRGDGPRRVSAGQCGREYHEESLRRTARWARRCKEAHERRDQALFGIVQGGLYRPEGESLGLTVEIGFDGYAVGASR